MVDAVEKKNEILKAAGECFARFGYEKTTLDDIGRMVGLNKASLYYYYKNKEAIFSEVIFQETEKLFFALQQIVQQASGCKEQILRYVLERLKYVQQMTNLRNLSVETVQSIKPIFETLYQQFLEREIDYLTNLLNGFQAKNEIIACDTRKIAASILTVADAVKQKNTQSNGCFLINQPDNEKMADEVGYIIGLILDGILRK